MQLLARPRSSCAAACSAYCQLYVVSLVSNTMSRALGRPGAKQAIAGARVSTHLGQLLVWPGSARQRQSCKKNLCGRRIPTGVDLIIF